MLCQVVEQTPLTTLLAWAWVAFTIEIDNAVEATGSEHVGRLFRISLATWANALRFIDEEGVTGGRAPRSTPERPQTSAGWNAGDRYPWATLGPKRREGFGSHRGVRGNTVLRPTRRRVICPTPVAEHGGLDRAAVARTLRPRKHRFVAGCSTAAGRHDAMVATGSAPLGRVFHPRRRRFAGPRTRPRWWR